MLVSICMATYNGGFLKEQMDSILDQRFEENKDVELEVIVIDDGSTDDTLEILASYHDPRIKILEHKKHRKYKYYAKLRAVTDNFTNAKNYAHGDYIFLSDQDDIWYPWKVDCTLTELRKKGGVVCTAFHTTFDKGPAPHKIEGIETYNFNTPFFSVKTFGIYGFSLGMDKKELDYILPFPSKIPAHDTYIAYASRARHHLHFLNRPCAIHRYFAESASAMQKDHDPLAIKLLFRIILYCSVLWRLILKK